jgi:hypothetical protein
MITVLGNSIERIILHDLNDIVYYHQKKRFTDQEYASSKDLQKQIKAGNLIKMGSDPNISNGAVEERLQWPIGGLSASEVGSKQGPVPASSARDQVPVPSSTDITLAVHTALHSALQESEVLKNLGQTVLDAVHTAVGKELDKRKVTGTVESSEKKESLSKPSTPVYVPTVVAKDFKSNIIIEEKSSSDNVSKNLEALKQMKK